MDQRLVTIGVSHQTAPVAVREGLAYAESELLGALTRLKERAPSVSEAVLLSTCKRVELIGVGADVECAVSESVEFLDRGIDLLTFAPVSEVVACKKINCDSTHDDKRRTLRILKRL
jgi:glutamyl-tRNA reductase